MRPFVFAVLTFLVISAFSQQEIRVKPGFYTAEVFAHSSDQGQLDYAMGVVDGMLLAPFFGAPRSQNDGQQYEVFEDCVTDMSGKQVGAIISKYVREHPERWNDPMNVVAYSAMTKACSQK